MYTRKILLRFFVLTTVVASMTGCNGNLQEDEAKRLIVSRLGIGNVSCTVDFRHNRFGLQPLKLSNDGTNITISGADAKTCAKSLTDNEVITSSQCQEFTDNSTTCSASLISNNARVHCFEGEGTACWLSVYSCGTEQIEDLSIVTEGKHAQLKFRVATKWNKKGFKGCPDPAKQSENVWTAKASRNDQGQWLLDSVDKVVSN